MILSGWSKSKSFKCKVSMPETKLDLKKILIKNKNFKIICRGRGRSYGYSSIQPNKTIILKKLNKILNFNKKTGIITVESGLTLNELLKIIVPHNWFIPVSPGTKFVTIGGMFASDVHGKNDHISGSFSKFVKYIKLINLENKEIRCSKKTNKKIFKCTAGGMGSTGIITEVSFKLKKIKGNYIKEKKLVVSDTDKIINTIIKSGKKFEYTVAWLDLANIKKKVNAIIYLGEHADNRYKQNDEAFKINIRYFLFLKFLLNNIFIKLFNKLSFIIARLSKKDKIKNLNNFFYPLDKIKNWNLLYGQNGFVQFQCVVPLNKSIEFFDKITRYMKTNNLISYLSVLKNMSGKSDSLINFGINGISLAMDFPNSKNIRKHLIKMSKIVIKFDGRIYLTKENFLTKNLFIKMYPNWKIFINEINKNEYKQFRSIQTEKLFSK